MNDAELRVYFGLSEGALRRLKLTARFPQRDRLLGKTDSKMVGHYFDLRAGLVHGAAFVDGPENFTGT